MSRIRYWISRLLQKLAGIWYEGPEPPSRLGTSVEAFAFTHPVASREQWAAFAIQLAETAYQAGYQRGYEQRVEDVEVLAANGIVVPMTQHAVQWEQATPHKLETEEHIAETVELRAQSGKVMKVALETALGVDPELKKAEDAYWKSRAGQGPSRR